MDKYIEAIGRLFCEDSARGCLTACVIGIAATILVLAALALTVLTNGLTLLAPLLWWGYIVYKEANK